MTYQEAPAVNWAKTENHSPVQVSVGDMLLGKSVSRIEAAYNGLFIFFGDKTYIQIMSDQVIVNSDEQMIWLYADYNEANS